MSRALNQKRPAELPRPSEGRILRHVPQTNECHFPWSLAHWTEIACPPPRRVAVQSTSPSSSCHSDQLERKQETEAKSVYLVASRSVMYRLSDISNSWPRTVVCSSGQRAGRQLRELQGAQFTEGIR